MRLDKMVKATKPRKPLRSSVEIAKQLDVSVYRLSALMKRDDAPKPSLVTITTQGKKITWYEPEAFINWYRRISNE